MNIFEKRESIQPYEYPHLINYAKAIHHAFWEVDHFTYGSDVKDFKVELNDLEREVVERSMLSIGVVENKVKSFWARLDQRMPKTEISDVGYTFAGNEVIHRLTYEKTINLLNLQHKFDHILEVPAMRDRVNYLNKYLTGISSRSNKEFTKSLILFTLLVENASLFSQFLTISSFSKYKNLMKNFSKVINATAREEVLHGKFGSELINIIHKENPEWFDDEMEDKTRRAVRKAYTAELKVLDWIFEKGELDFISKEEIAEFLKSRLNDSLNQIGYADEYEVDENLLKKSNYMETMILATKDFDFFDGKSTDYNKSNNAYNYEELWD
jgi:ribonucleoside-diphosphate reductase beta chain